MSKAPTKEAPKPVRRRRLIWTLLGAMILVSLVPLIISHAFLTGINRDSLETLEKKYLTRSAVGISNDIQNLLGGSTKQLHDIAGSVRVMQKALPTGTDPFIYAARSGWIGDMIAADSNIIALRVLNLQGQGAEADRKSVV